MSLNLDEALEYARLVSHRGNWHPEHDTAQDELALAVMDDDGWGCAITTAPEPPAVMAGNAATAEGK